MKRLTPKAFRSWLLTYSSDIKTALDKLDADSEMQAAFNTTFNDDYQKRRNDAILGKAFHCDLYALGINGWE